MSLFERALSKMNPPVFLGSAAVVVAFVVFAGAFPGVAFRVFDSLQTFLVGTFGWFYVCVASALLVFSLWLLLRRIGLSNA